MDNRSRENNESLHDAEVVHGNLTKGSLVRSSIQVVTSSSSTVSSFQVTAVEFFAAAIKV